MQDDAWAPEGEPWTKTVRVSELVDGRLVRARRGATPLVVGRIEGVVRVFVDRCPHAGAPLSTGPFDGRRVVCTRHRFTFDCATAACLTDPVYQLRMWEVREADGWIETRPPATEIW